MSYRRPHRPIDYAPSMLDWTHAIGPELIDWSTSPTLASNAQNNVTRESSDGGWASESDHSLEPDSDDTEDQTVNLLNFEEGDTIFMGITMKHYQQILKLKRRSSKRVVIIINPHLFKPEALERVGRIISNYCNLKKLVSN